MLAVSGGADSRALLEAMALWEGRHLGKVVVAAIDHGVRKESAQEAAWVAKRAQSLGFKGLTEALLVAHLHGEQDFRKARYECLERIAKKEHCSSIVLAHNGDDDAEGFLMSLLGKGGGALGAAMEPLDIVHGIRVIRPFLKLFKRDLLQFLTLFGYTNFVRDNHDLELRNERAKVRLKAIPSFVQNDPNFMGRLQKYAQKQRDINRYFKEESENIVVFDDSLGATVDLARVQSSWILESAIKWTLKKLAPCKDMRASEPIVLRILEDCFSLNLPKEGLDQAPKLFKVNLLEEKQYQFPGVLVRTSGNKLVFTLI